MKVYMALFFAFMLLFAGCINLDIDLDGDNGQANGNGSGAVVLNPSFSVVYPANNGEVETVTDSADVEVLLQTTDITLTAPSATNVEGDGHFILALDGESETISESSFTFEAVPLGEHTLVVEFVNNDGTSYDPELKETVSFSVVLKEGVTVGPHEYTVNLENGAFDPDSLFIKEGDMVTFVNYESMPHAVAVKKGQSNVGTSNPLNTGESYTYTFENSGEYTFVSLTIPTITGTVVVSK